MSNNKPSSEIKPLSFDTYTNYLLSKNLCQMLKEYNYKKIDKRALFLLTNIAKSYIENITTRAKNYTELSGRLEVNLLDLFYSLLASDNVDQEYLLNYIHNSKLQCIMPLHIQKQYSNEEQKRFLLLKKLNSANVCDSSVIPRSLLNSIPKSLRYFPRDFALQSSENIIEPNEQFNQKKKEMKSIEKKSIEDIISSNSYYDMSKKHSRATKNVDILSYFTEIAKSNTEDKENVLFGKRFKLKDGKIKTKEGEFNLSLAVNNDNIDKQIYDNNLLDKNNFEDDLK